MSATEQVINLAEDFSPYPAGRDHADGPFNGARFRDEILRPRLADAIARGQTLVVSLDGVKSFGSSFLEEAFGGLVRIGVSKKDVIRYLHVRATGDSSQRYLDAIKRYVSQA